MTQKILAAHAGLPSVSAGQLIEAKLDLVLGNDVTSPVAINEMVKKGFKDVFSTDKIALVMDHFTPNKDIKSAENVKQVRLFAKEKGIKNFFDVGKMGIEHALLPESGLVISGDAVIGADSHTCTYGALGAFSTGVGSTDMAAGMISGKAWFKVPSAIKVVLKGTLPEFVSGKDVILHLIGKIGVDGARYRSLEFTGDGVGALSMDDRFCIANMAIECGAKNGIFPVDDKTLEYISGRTDRQPRIFEADEDAEYDETIEIDLNKLKPTVAFPHLPENTHTVDEIEKIDIDQVVIGSCTNGRIEDMRAAAKFRGGECLSETMEKGRLYKKLRWKCACGHEFEGTPYAILFAGHWCEDCIGAQWRCGDMADENPFFAQVWKPLHADDDNFVVKTEFDPRTVKKLYEE